MNYFVIILLLIISYLLGSVPSGYLLGKYIKKIDITKTGSKSTGATNTTRILGPKLGVIALLFDLIKGVIIMSILIIFELDQFYILDQFYLVKEVNILSLYGMIAVFGHVFSIFLNFRGGKAVATSAGVLLFLTPLVGLITITLFIIIILVTKYVSLGSIIASMFGAILSLVLSLTKTSNFLTIATPSLSEIPLFYSLSFIVLALLIAFRHHQNIVRLINKEENKLKLKRS